MSYKTRISQLEREHSASSDGLDPKFAQMTDDELDEIILSHCIKTGLPEKHTEEEFKAHNEKLAAQYRAERLAQGNF